MDTALQPGARYSPAGDHREDPYPFYALARDTEPVFFSAQLQMWCVTRYDDAAAVLADHETFSSRNAIPDNAELGPQVRAVLSEYRQPKTLLNMDRPDHTALRRLVQQVFSTRRVAAMEPAVREVTTALTDQFSGGRADLIDELVYPLPLTVIFRLLGIPEEDIPLCRQWTGDLKQLLFSGPRLPVARQVELARGVAAQQQYLDELAAERETAPGEDLISHLIQAKDTEGNAQLSQSEVSDMTQNLIIGGHETLANALGNILHLLLADPGRWRALREDPALIEAAVEEGMRADTGIIGIIRTATRPVAVGGTDLPEGARLFVMLGSANTDERRYPDPSQFRLDRAGQPAHLGLGHGIHYCVGAPLGRLEARVAVEVLTQRFPGMRPDPDARLRHLPVPLFRGFAGMPVIWDA
ncbi:MAG TPA: cytochrome P450 [Trebonia sp.]|jgi:cytochrome P450